MELEVRVITPYQAKKWLEKNHPQNRPIAWGQVEALANDIGRDAWRLTHQGVCFDAEGQLIDGQHRLHAIVRANKAVKMVVAKNDEGAFETPIDRGRPRSLTMITGLPGRQIASLKLLKQLEGGFYNTTPITMADIEEISGHHVAALEAAHSIKSFYRLHAGVQAAIVWSLPVDKNSVMGFANSVITGEMLAARSPALQLKKILSKDGRKMPTTWNMAMLALNCIRHHLTDTTLSRVFSTESGYRAITAQRRKHKIPHTPSADLVPGLTFRPTAREDEADGE